MLQVLEKIDVKKVVGSLVKLTALMFLFAGTCSFVLFGLFEAVYYYKAATSVVKLSWLAITFSIAFPLIIELGQLAFMFGTVHNLTSGKSNGVIYSAISLMGTIAIVFFKLIELNHMVIVWGSSDLADMLAISLQALIWAGLGFELRIILLLNEK